MSKQATSHRPKVHFLVTHPVQYYAPWYRAMHESGELNMKVWFSFLPKPEQQGAGFGKAFEWDVPLLEGYPSEVLPQPQGRPMSFNHFRDIRNPSLVEVFRSDRPDLMVINGWNYLSMLQGLFACRRLGIPVIVRGEANAMRQRPWYARLVHELLLKQYAACLAIGKSGAEFYRRNGVPDENIFFARYFIDGDHFARGCEEGRAQRATLRQKWAIDDAAYCFLFVGKLEEKKRVFDVLDAIGKIEGNVHLLIAGSGEQENDAKRMADQKGLPVSFTGFLNQSELPTAYAAADAMVLPSNYGETWGLVVNEAMACGLPVIVSDRVGCGPDLIDEGVTGLCFEFGDTGQLARCMTTLMSDRDKSSAMGAAARDRVSSYNAGEAASGAIEAIRYVMALRQDLAPSA